MPGRHTVAAHFRPDIEGLRAVAVLMVLAFHAGLPFVPGGFAGVDVFFVISGFLITGLLVREVERSGRISLLAFYARRAKRLLPAASLVLLVTGLLTWSLVPKARWADVGGDLVASAAYVINWRLARRSVDYLAEDAATSPVQHYWSLAVEEQFYIVWPLIIVLGAWLVHRHRLRARPVLGTLLAVVVLASFGWSVVLTADQPETAYFVTTTRLWELGIGGLVAITSSFWQRLAPGPATGLAWVGLLALALSATLLGPGTPWPGHAALLPTLGTAAVVAGGFAARSRCPVRILGAAPMREIGATSYSLYLWHWPLLVVAAAVWGELAVWQGVAVAVFAYLPSRLTYALVENPVRSAPIMSRLPGLALGTGAACTVLGAGAGVTLVHGMESAVVRADAGQGAEALRDTRGPVPEPPAATGTITGTGDSAPRAADPAPDRPRPELSPERETGPDPQAPDPPGTGPDISQVDLTPGSISPDPLLATSDLPGLYARGCSGRLGSAEVVHCVSGDVDGELAVAVVGDSKIGQWGDALEQIAVEEEWQLHLYVRDGCPWTAATIDEDGSCLQWGERVHALLLGEARPDVVIVSGVKQGSGEGTRLERSERLAAGYVDYWSDLRAVDVPVVVLSDSPNPGGRTVYECVSEHREDVSPCVFDRSDGSGTAALREAAAQVPTATFLTMNDWICPLEACPPVIGDVLVYRQGSHITNTYALSLLEPLRDRLVPAVEQATAASTGGSG